MRVPKKNIFLFVLIFFISKNLHAQSLQDLINLEKEEKTCLDTSPRKTKCVAVFKQQMDSLLTLAYQSLYKKSKGKEEIAVEKNQFDWLKKQREFERRIDAQYSLEVTEKDFGETAAMIALSEKADFVRDRIKELLRKCKTLE